MASTYSALKIELLETGANSGTWGTATNVNLGDAVLGEAITGSATVDFATDADVTITLTDSATSQAARNLRLNITESSSGVGSVRNLILGSGCQIEKFYLINNTGTGAKTVKNTSGTGISVPAGKATLVFNNGTNVVDAASYFTSLTLGSALPVASGGTGLTAGTSGGVLAYTASGTLASSGALTASALVLGGGAGAAPATTTTGTGVVTALGVNTGTAGAFVVNGGALGTPSSGTLTLATGLPLTSGVTGLLPIANGGTATATPSLVQGSGVTITGTWPNQTINATGTGGTVTAVSVASANGLAGTSSGGATPALTLSTSITGVLKGNGTAISAATAGTDYLAPPSGTALLKANSGGALANATAGTDYVAPGTATTFTATQTFSGTSSAQAIVLNDAAEVATIAATAATGTIAYDITTQSVLYYTTSASGNFTVNFRGSSGTSLDTLMSTGQSMTVAFLVTQGGTAYYNSAVQVDGSSVTPKYQGGTAYTAGNANSIDVYMYTIIKTGSAAFTVFTSQTKFA